MAEADSSAGPDTPPQWPGWLVATAICVRFWSRLPMPALPGERDIHALPDFRTVPRALPFAALVIALPAALVVLLAGLARLDSLVAAALGLSALALTTGAFHEDGLADSVDGLFGGQTPERRLEIMKDSRVGSYGAIAIGLSLLLRGSLIAMIATRAGPWAAAVSLLLAAPWSRSEGLLLLAREAAARSHGASAAVGRPSPPTASLALFISAVLALALAATAKLPLIGVALGLGLAHGAATAMRRLARRLIGGQTGDIVGAVQQLGEIAIYLGLALALGWGGR